MSLTESDLDVLDDADIAAFTARRRWISDAKLHRSGGKQLPPTDDEWQILLFRCGRGFGKSRSLYEHGWWEGWRVPGLIIHAVAPTLSDARGTTFEGPAGFNSIIPAECLYRGSLDRAYNSTARELRLSNGSKIRGFGAIDEGSRLRGPQCHLLLGDEIAQWDRPAGNLELTLNNALYGLRLPYPDGTPSRAVLGTTPKPIPFLKRLEKRPGVRLVTGTSYDNIDNLSATFRQQLFAQEQTLMGKQEIYARFIDDESDLSILKRRWINLFPAFQKDGKTPRKLPPMSFIVEAYDTATSEHNYSVKTQTTDPTACVVLGVFNIREAFGEDEIRRLGIRGRYGAILCDCWAERLGLPELLEKARTQHRVKWGASPGKRSDVVLIEQKSSGPSMRQMLAQYNVPCWPYNPHNQSKTQRAHAIAPLVAQGLLWIPESARPDMKGMPRNWANDFLDEVCAFAGPGSTPHDDYVDALTSALLYLRDRAMLEATPEHAVVDYEEKVQLDREEAQRLYDEERMGSREAPYG